MAGKVSKAGLVSKNFLSLFLCLVLFSCSSGKNEKKTEENQEVVQLQSPKTSMSLFFPKKDGSGLEKILVEVENVQNNNNLWFELLLKSLTHQKKPDLLPVFSEKPELTGLFLDKDTLYLDFSNKIQKMKYPSIQIEQLSLEAFLSTIKENFPNIMWVKFLSDHEDTRVIFGHTYAQQPFSLKDL